MSAPRKQHYVPQTYLKNFLPANHKTSQLYVLSVPRGEIYLSHIRDIAAERNFYTIDHLDNKYLWEETYAKSIEPLLSHIIKKYRQRCENSLIQNCATVLDPGDKFSLSLSIFFQLFRGKHTRDFEKQVYDRELPLIIKKVKESMGLLNEDNEKKLLEFEKNEDLFKSISIPTLFDKERILTYAYILMQYNFVFYRIAGPGSFITSDNPVMLTNCITFDTTPFTNGIANPTTMLFFPLSSKLLLGAYHPEMFRGCRTKYDGILEILSKDREEVFILNHNTKQREHCKEFVYSPSREALEQIR